ncbi:hypothetical protein [Cellulomonas fengjieae]|uniref:Uncharacterized protein n=1 Tax=Cellulomonas fengjieae TaxID=2819978 RepID=A0ABS3SGU8_9CELL|nr:hypothetical protein [Cellulomonas fengjieae]MBO3084973.1 hypothetical protein [Cellulomonas fengjieae]MBO3100720.1 hypothetical protein [Cellulomonas fengjieae]QVI66429.1 hypothetical protein KG102_02130 [Cellulomonas fengjieae]
MTTTLLVGAAALWAARTLAEAERVWAMDPEDRALSQALTSSRASLHDRVGELRSRHPHSDGLRALNELNRETGPTFFFVAMDEDGQTRAEVGLEVRAELGIIWPRTVHASVCLDVTIEPATQERPGTITSEQTPCSASISPTDPPRPPHRDGIIPLDRLRTTVPKPTPPPPDRPVCYSGTDCTDVGG